jgi:hypothetical protein
MQEAGLGHEHPTVDAGKAGCLKFCADESSTLAKGHKTQHDLPGPAPMAGVQATSVIAVATVAPWRPVERPASLGPPLVIRLLRLTT